jgi:hypothetical protein
MQRAAGRPKDLLAIEELGTLRQDLDRPQDFAPMVSTCLDTTRMKGRVYT